MTTTINSGHDIGGIIESTGAVDWSDLNSSPFGSWATWTSWNPVPNNISITVWADAGSTAWRRPTIGYFSQGQVSLSLKISDQVDSNMVLVAPTTINFAFGTEYTFPKGRYYEYTITVAPTLEAPIPKISKFTIDFDTTPQTEYIDDLDTLTLTGTLESGFTVPTTVGVVTNVMLSAKPFTYVVEDDELYWNDVYVQPLAATINWRDKSPVKVFISGVDSVIYLSHTKIDLQIRGLATLRQSTDGVE